MPESMGQPLLRRINRLFNIRGHEWNLLSWLIAHFAVAQLGMTLLQSVHLGLLLNSFGRSALPVYFLAKGGVLFVISLFYSLRVIGRVSRQTEILSFLGLLGAILMGARLLSFGEHGWEPGVFLSLSVFAEVFVSMFTLQCWGLYSDCMDSRQSKRLLPLIGAGGTLGAMLGGWIASGLARPLGAENLLFVCLFFVCLLGLLSIHLLIHHLGDNAGQPQPTSPESAPTAPPNDSIWQGTKAIFSQIFQHRLLLQFMLIIMSVKLGCNLAEYQQQLLLSSNFGKDGITAFLGSYLAITNLLALVIQLFVENRIIQSFGPLFGLASTPFCIGIAASGFLISPTLMVNTVGRSAEQLTNKSLYKTSVNLVYLAFPSELRRRLRIVINGLLEFFAVLPFVVVTLVLPRLPIQGYALSALAASILALVLVFSLRRPYQNQLQAALLSRPLKLDEDSDPLYSTHSYAQLAETNLDSEDPQRIRFSLELLQTRSLPVAANRLEPLLEHSQSSIRLQTLNTLGSYGNRNQNLAVFSLLARETEPEVRQAAIRALRNWVDERSNDTLKAYLHDPALNVRSETLIVLFTRGGLEGILHAAGDLKALLSSQDSTELKAAAYIMGEIGTAYFRKDLNRLLIHPDTAVQLEALKAAGQSPHPIWIGPLIARLGQRERALALQARLSLQRFSPEQLLPELEQAYLADEALNGPYGNLSLRSGLIRVLEGIPGASSATLLQNWLARAPWPLKQAILRALIRLVQGNSLKLNERLLYLEVQAVLRDGFACVEILWLLRRQRSGRLELLASELELRLGYARELLFQLLSLLYNTADIQQAELNYASGEPYYRGLSLDLLAQLLGRSLGPPSIHLLEDAPLDKKVQFARSHALLAEHDDSNWSNRALLQDHPLLRRLMNWCQPASADYKPSEDPMLDTIYLLKQTPLFARLGLEQLEPVARVCRPESRPAQTVIFSEGTPAQALYIIRSGSVSVESEGQTLATLKAPEVFGEVEVLHAALHLATIRTLEPCELLVIKRQDFGELLEDYPAFARGLVEILFERLRAAFERGRKDHHHQNHHNSQPAQT